MRKLKAETVENWFLAAMTACLGTYLAAMVCIIIATGVSPTLQHDVRFQHIAGLI